MLKLLFPSLIESLFFLHISKLHFKKKKMGERKKKGLLNPSCSEFIVTITCLRYELHGGVLRQQLTGDKAEVLHAQLCSALTS